MFTIKLYKFSGENELVDKSRFLSDEISFSGVLKEETNIMSPSIVIEATNLIGYNYAYISEFGRYYYINSIDSVSNKLWRINLKCDVLYTYNAQIRQQQAIIEKQESEYINKMFNDGSFEVTQDTGVEVIQFPNSFGGETLEDAEITYILTCI